MDADADASIAVSPNNGLNWTPVWQAGKSAGPPADVKLVEPVIGAYETLVKVSLAPTTGGQQAVLKNFQIETTTMLNAKTQPRLNLEQVDFRFRGNDKAQGRPTYKLFERLNSKPLIWENAV